MIQVGNRLITKREDVGFQIGTRVPGFAGSGPAVDAFAAQIQDARLALARNGDPSCDSLGPWPAYGDQRQTMMLGEKCFVAHAPYDEKRRVWDVVPAAVGTF